MKDFKKEWNAIINSTNQKKALVDHFSYLADSPNYDKLLEAIMQEVEEVYIEDDSLLISFQIGVVLSADKPEEEIADHFPSSFKEKLKYHQFLSVDESEIVLGDEGLFCEDDGWFEAMNEWKNIGDLNDVISPLRQGSDLWLYHPTEKNSSGNPKLYFISHEGGDVYDPRYINIGALFLEQLADLLYIDILDALTPVNEEELFAWWRDLDDAWKRFFSKELSQEEPSSSYIKKLWKETSFYLDEKTGITTLDPLKVFKKLDSLVLENLEITDINLIKELTELERLAIVNIPFKDFNGFEHLSKLKTIRLINTGFSNLNSLKSFKKLYSLVLNNNPLKSLDGIEYHSELVRLEIDDTQITSIAPLKELKNLSYLNICRLLLTDYPLLASMDNESIINIRVVGSPVGDFKALELGLSLKKYFEFLTKIDGENDQGIPFPTSNDTICSIEEFITHLNTIDFPVNKYADIICLFANRLLLNSLKSKSKELCHMLISQILKMKLKISQRVIQLWMTNVIMALCILESEAELEQPVLQCVHSLKITDPTLAFNLACFYALKNEKSEMLKSIKAAMKLGKPKNDFIEDKDFSVYLNDPDFLKVLNEG